MKDNVHERAPAYGKTAAAPDQFTFDYEPIRGYPELRWTGKRPFRGTSYFPAQLKESHGDTLDGWRNKIYWGDNLQVMSHLLREHRGKVRLIYIDPPFDSKADYKKKIELRSGNAASDMSAFEEKQYTDIWTNDEYLQFMYERLILMRELLAEDGSIYIHCDWHKGHYLRLICDEVFGPTSFKNNIIWYYYNKMQGNINRFASNHDDLYLYTKKANFLFNKIFESRGETIKQIKRVWNGESQSLVNAKDEDGKVVYIETDKRTIDDVWRMSMLQPADKKEPLGYPTQKPEALLERIISASSNPGDLVFDCFMGSGTTQAVAMKLGRRFIGADINLGAVQTTTKRLLGVAEELKDGEARLGIEDDKPTKFYIGFEVYTVNYYDFFRNELEAKELLIEALEIQELPNNMLWDGEKDGWMVKILAVNRLATAADLNLILSNLDYKVWEKRAKEHPEKAVERIRLVCMGHDPELRAQFTEQMDKMGYRVDIEVLDILRDKQELHFKREAEAKITLTKKKLEIKRFYPMNLLQKLSLEKSKVGDWRELVDSVLIDFNYDGVVFSPVLADIPDKKELVSGVYDVPADAGTIRVKITDLLAESWEGNVEA
ncbi:MAG: site-specific DNA-methyltransferase [Spirochaetes bacterium]|nr:site-specific DNA-methyltransferase [Spirochaetota bacterium]